MTAAGMGHVVVLDDDPLCAYSQDLLSSLSPPDIGLDRCGTLWVAETPDQLPTSGGEILDEQALREAEPALRPGLAGALLVPDDFVVYQPALTRWLLAGLDVKEHTRVDRLDALKADVIVNATGPWAPTLTPGLPIIPRKGHLVVTDRVPGFCRHQVAELGYVQSATTL